MAVPVRSVPARSAATVLLVRDGTGQDGEPVIEVCMLRRNLNASFAAGAHVFPGGSVDHGDGDPELESRCRGRTDAEASATLGLPEGGLAFWVAAVRECFEEAGVVLAYPPATGEETGPGARVGSPVMLDSSDPAVRARFTRHRDELNAGSARFVDVCKEEGLELATDALHYISRWITPGFMPKRFDTRFFVCAAPPGQVALHDDGETIATIWLRPAEALDRNRRGEVDLLPPTIANLETVGRFATTEALLRAAATMTAAPALEAVVATAAGEFKVLRPGDAGYQDAVARMVADAG
jgi:8-oxo-dGTP pyrophosphatase MutT (NUDIX family)